VRAASFIAAALVAVLPVGTGAQEKPAPKPAAPPASAAKPAVQNPPAKPAPKAPPQAEKPGAEKAPSEPAPVEAAPTPPPAPDAATAAAYTYQPDGRRDPFLSLIGTGVQTSTPGLRGEGPAGMTVSELSVRGVMQSRGALVAMVQGPDNRTYILRSGDKLADGIVKAVTSAGLVIVQDINDPLSIERQREVRKLLRSLEDAK
jgi:Tfp pilus assembly protein PilP